MKNFYALLFLFAFANAFAQGIGDYQFISPKPGSEQNTLESTIIIRDGASIDRGSLSSSLITVTGTISGDVQGKLLLSPDNQTIIFKPFQTFSPDEVVQVQLDAGIRTTGGRELTPLRFTFSVAPFQRTPNPYAIIPELQEEYPTNKKTAVKKVSDEPPANFPAITLDVIDSSKVEDGYVFLTISAEVEGVGYYLMMLNNDGTPFYYKELENDYAYDFKMQPNGLLTYAQFFEHHSYTGGGNVTHMIMDNSFEVIDSVQMGNGYVAEAHDFQILPNGHYLLFGYYLTKVDMSKYVEGGYPNAYVSGGVVQELDADKNVVFQWRSWDEFSFDTYQWGNRTDRPVVSTFHLNTITLDKDFNIILGTPVWTKKLNRQTGKIMWNLGGDDNEFTFVGVDSADGSEHFGGHTVYRMENDNFLIYDNSGRRGGDSSSEVHEYRVDEEALVAEHVWTYRPAEDIGGWHRGSAQRLPNGNTMIGWGGSAGELIPAATEVTPDGEVVWQVSFEHPELKSYRAVRHKFNGGAAAAEVIETEVAAGATYTLNVPDEDQTGVELKINTLSGSGYNELSATRYNYAPTNPEFFQKPPQLLSSRIVLDGNSITSISADIRFDAEFYKVRNPDAAIVYHREFEGSGLFLPLPTTYNAVTGMIEAEMEMFGEFVIGHPDLEEVAYAPYTISPEDGGEINQNLPVRFEWNALGFVEDYDLQVATENTFASPVVSEEGLMEANFILEAVDAGVTYYWRVRTNNEAGTSDWCEPGSFTAVAPFINIVSPAGGEELQRGLEYFFEWNDNIDEDVEIAIASEGSEEYSVIDTAPSDRAYLYEIPAGMEPGNYLLKISSVTDSDLYAVSNSAFSIIDTVTSVEDELVPTEYALHQNYPNPFNPSTDITFTLPHAAEVKLEVYNLLGQKVRTLVNGYLSTGVHTYQFNAEGLTSGLYLYRIESEAFTQTRKCLLLK